MKKKSENVLASIIALIALIALLLLSPNFVLALDTMYYGDGDQSLRIRGWLRNNTGWFLDDQPYQQNDDRLATERTWMRAYADWRPSETFRTWVGVQFAYEPEYDVEEGSVSEPDGKEYSEYDDINDVLREAYVEWIPNKKTDVRIGRQVLIWGESLTERIGDVIQPENTRFTFAFANMEDTRIPQWMVRGIHDIDTLNSSFEWVVNPLLVSEEYRVNMQAEYAKQEFGPSGPVWVPGQRFGIHPEDRPGAVTCVSVPAEVPTGFDEIYPDTWDDMRYGFRTNTYTGAVNFGFLYWHTQSYDVVVQRGAVVGQIPVNPFFSLNIRNYDLVHPTMDIYGAFMNVQFPWPGVFRGEVIYSPNKSFNTFDFTDADAIVERDYYKYMVAYDLNSFLYFNWHKTAPFDLTFEHVGEWIPDSDNLQYVIYGTEQKSFVPRFGLRLYTSWFYDKLQTEFIVNYRPWANSGIMMPTIKWKPGLANDKFSLQLRYINVFGDNDYEGLGFLRTKDMIVLTTEFAF